MNLALISVLATALARQAVMTLVTSPEWVQPALVMSFTLRRTMKYRFCERCKCAEWQRGTGSGTAHRYHNVLTNETVQTLPSNLVELVCLTTTAVPEVCASNFFQ